VDLNQYGIKVSQISPGLVETEFSKVRFKGDNKKAATAYEGLEALQAVDIAEIASFILSRPEHVNIGDVLVLSKAQANTMVLHRK